VSTSSGSRIPKPLLPESGGNKPTDKAYHYAKDLNLQVYHILNTCGPPLSAVYRGPKKIGKLKK
jgi:hypothetical protein